MRILPSARKQLSPKTVLSDTEGSLVKSDVKRLGRKEWRSRLLLVSSAVFGGIAVALWNRRTLAGIRLQLEKQAADQLQSEPGWSPYEE